MVKIGCSLLILFLLLSAQKLPADSDLESRVRKFLEARQGTWNDLNVPPADGQKLHDIIIAHNYKSALEIGTSTGYSGIWIALALSKTNGKLVTIEIDKERYDIAVANFKSAGVSRYVDIRLGDAHEIVPTLTGPFDFVFSDADKDWYKNYLVAVLPKLSVGGCFVAHNISEYVLGYKREFLNHLLSLSFMETTFEQMGAGMSVSYRKALK